VKRAVCAVFLTSLLLLGPIAPAPAAPPCWKSLLTDWYDGSIDKVYPIPCYRQAVNHLPTDAQLYSSAKDDILRAMANAVAAQNQASETRPTTTTTTEASGQVDTTPSTTAATTTNEAAVPTTTTTPSPGRKKPKGIARALDKLNPGDADSFPLPLLILGALAILLVAAGVVGMIWRRMDRGDPGPDVT
jgi:cobalamin biosynthesis Mg chelatase CobN